MHRRARRGFGEALASVLCFAAVLGVLVAVDDRVGERISAQWSGPQISTWGDRAAAVATVVIDVARTQSLAHAPLLLFSLVAIVLVLFMLRL
jgi:hypothetical protein